MARSSVATDNFNRANGGLGANWESLNSIDGGEVEISSNVIGGANTGAFAVSRWVGAGTFSDDQYSSLVFLETDFGVSPYGMGVVARASGDTDTTRDYYYFFANSNDTYVLGKVVNGTNTNLATGSRTWVDGERIEIECEGTTIRGMVDGVSVASVTDASLTTGKPGVLGSGDSFVATGDDWDGGDIVAGAVSVALGGSASTGQQTTPAVGTAVPL